MYYLKEDILGNGLREKIPLQIIDSQGLQEVYLRLCLDAFHEYLPSHLMDHPEELEDPPEEVRFDPGVEYHVPKIQK